MKDDEVLVVKCNAFISESERQDLHDKIQKEIMSGVVVLPNFCDVIIASENMEIGLERRKDGTV